MQITWPYRWRILNTVHAVTTFGLTKPSSFSVNIFSLKILLRVTITLYFSSLLIFNSFFILHFEYCI